MQVHLILVHAEEQDVKQDAEKGHGSEGDYAGYGGTVVTFHFPRAVDYFSVAYKSLAYSSNDMDNSSINLSAASFDATTSEPMSNASPSM